MRGLRVLDGVGARLHPRQLPRRDAPAARGLRRARAHAQAVRQADRQVPVGRQPARRHEGAARHLPAARLSHRRAQGREAGRHDRRSGDRQAVCLGVLREVVPRRRADLRRLRLHDRAAGRARPARLGGQHAVLGHVRDPAQHHRARVLACERRPTRCIRRRQPGADGVAAPGVSAIGCSVLAAAGARGRSSSTCTASKGRRSCSVFLLAAAGFAVNARAAAARYRLPFFVAAVAWRRLRRVRRSPTARGCSALRPGADRPVPPADRDDGARRAAGRRGAQSWPCSRGGRRSTRRGRRPSGRSSARCSCSASCST